MGITNISFRTEAAKRDELDKIAATMDRDRSWVINEALDNYLELHRWHLDHIKAGMAATAAGRTLSTEQVRANIARHHATTLARKSPKNK